MSGKTKNFLIAVLTVGIISMTIAYANLTQRLNINGAAQIQRKSDSWNIHFTDIVSGNSVVTHGYASVPDNSTLQYTDNSTTVTLPQVTLKTPGDYVEFYFDVENTGDITGYLNTINNITIPAPSYANNEALTSEQRTALEAAITGSLTNADGTALSLNTSIAKNGKIPLKVTITFENTGGTQVLPSQNVTFTGITGSLIFGQDQVN